MMLDYTVGLKEILAKLLLSGWVILAIAGCSLSASPSASPTSTSQPDQADTLVSPLVTLSATPEHQPANTVESITPTTPANIVRGVIYDEQGKPLAGARVRQQTTQKLTLTNEDGSFDLAGIDLTYPVTITAWANGYFVGWQPVITYSQPVSISLKPYYQSDNPDYTWFAHEEAQGSLSCSHCMPCYTEWQQDTHSGSALNPRFLTMYNGTDVYGNRSPLTRHASTRDYGNIPLAPDLNQPYYGPGYKLDFPDSAGNCAACHIPAAASIPGMAYQVDPNRVTGVNQEGVFCEFCHKIGEVNLDPANNLPYPNMPGVLSMRLYRPDEGQQLFFGNFDDVTRRVSYSALFEQSAYCAGCHFGVFWDTVVYNSYGEWLASPYSDPEKGKTCQDCHMPPVDYAYFVFPEKGGLLRQAQPIYSHRMPGAQDEELLQNALSMQVQAEQDGDQIVVRVSLTNDNTGHHIPTDSPLRQMILLVEAQNGSGESLALLSGSTIPDWGGVGDPHQGYYAGLPGKAYARVLAELWTGITPSGAYWNPTYVVSDNRLAAFQTDNSQYSFSLLSGELAEVHVRLLYRRAYKDLMDQKGWDVPDILMKEFWIHVP
jgi:hypothetical protein